MTMAANAGQTLGNYDCGFWAIIGGKMPGIFKQRPHIPSGYRTPAFPVAIKCRSEQEADVVFAALSPIARQITRFMQPVEAALLFYRSAVAAELLKETVERFYSVVIGHESGIFMSWSECAGATSGFPRPLYKKHLRLSDALEWLITKGHRLGDATDVPSPLAPVLSFGRGDNTSASPFPSIEHHSLSNHVTVTPSFMAKGSRSSTSSSRSSHSSTSTTISSALSFPSTTQRRQWREPPPSDTAQHIERIYQVVCELDGTITRKLAQPEHDDTPLSSFGDMADWYLQAHGFSARAVLHIAYAHDTAKVANDFVTSLSRKGMPCSEAFFLWGLIAANMSNPTPSY